MSKDHPGRISVHLAAPTGRVLLIAEGDVLIQLSQHDSAAQARAEGERRRAEHQPENPLLAEAKGQLDEYFAGERRRFDLPLAPRGTDFQLQVWDQLLEIPYGETRTYGDLAAAHGGPGAARAVGQANHNNPIGIIIPCHRVIGSGGKLVGYASGLERKKQLLELEGAEVTRQLELF
ncbi:MAG: methylated-DNA--[protein]-cysteine S-methyltransferase [Acidobacteriota bacterium]